MDIGWEASVGFDTWELLLHADDQEVAPFVVEWIPWLQKLYMGPRCLYYTELSGPRAAVRSCFPHAISAPN